MKNYKNLNVAIIVLGSVSASSVFSAANSDSLNPLSHSVLINQHDFTSRANKLVKTIETRVQKQKLDYTDRIIIKLRPQSGSQQIKAMSADRLGTYSKSAGITLKHVRRMSLDAEVLKLPRRMTIAEAAVIARKLSTDPDVEYAEPDRILHALAIPNDTLFSNQWNFKIPAQEIGSINLPAAWDITRGSSNIVIGVIDSGILPHIDLAGRTVAGYDFVSENGPGNFLKANDGDGRDNYPADPGDWITPEEEAVGLFPGCGASDSSWHGTHVSGIVGAASNNGHGVSGVTWGSKILPVRVLGKCGGYLSDITDGMQWAAGLPVPGVPANPNPARILNLSLGSIGFCSATEQNSINAIIARNTVVVVAAGNEARLASDVSPGNCNGVITVHAGNRAGGDTFYSNIGSVIEISAPGGEQSFDNDPNGILSTLNTGTTSPAADDYRYLQGTSMATPQVAGVVALMLSVNPTLTPAQVLSIIQQTARGFPVGTGSDCTTSRCGAGIINARAAVNSAFQLQCAVDSDNDGLSNCIESTEGRNPAIKDNDVFGNPRLFAMQQYRDFLGREGDSGGITHWTNLLNSGTSRPQVIENFFNSPEFQGRAAPITRLYFAYFRRIPDYAGLLLHINRYRSGLPLATISQDFAGSAEFTNTYGSLNNDAFVRLVYSNVLGRAPDSNGFAFWTGELTSGRMSRGQVMLGFSESVEFKARSRNSVYVTMMYVGLLRRAPEQSGFDGWVNYLNAGNSGLNLISGFLSAPEYYRRFLP